MINEKYKQGITELLAILDINDKEYTDKIPKQLLDFFHQNASQTYQVTFDSHKELKDLKLKKETKGLLSMLYLYYWCEPNERDEYMNILKENQLKYDEAIRKSYNPNSPFLEKPANPIKLENKNSNQDSEKNQVQRSQMGMMQPSLSTKKVTIFTKLINKIKVWFQH